MANFFDQFEQATPQGSDAPPANYFDQFEVPKAAPQQRSPLDMLLGQTGPRHILWPEQIVRSIMSGVTLPGDVLKEATQPAPATISDSDVSTLGVGRALDAASIGTPVNPGVRSGDRMLPGVSTTLRPDKKAIPSSETLLQTGSGQLNKASDMGVEFTPQAVKELGQQLEGHLQSRGVSDEFAKETFGLVRRLANPPEDAVGSTFANLKTFRESLGEAAKSPDARERRAAKLAIDRVDNWLSSPHAEASLAGATTPEAAAAASEIYKTGRGNYAAGMRSEDITGRAEKADLKAAAANSGRNVDNATRQRFVDILTSDKAGRGYTQEELDAVERLVRGTPGMNSARYIANLLGGGGGFGQAATTIGSAGLGAVGGSALGNPTIGAAVGAAVPMTIGALAKSLSNTLTKRQVDQIDQLIRMRSPLFLEQPKVPDGLLAPSALMRGGLLGIDPR